MNSKEYFVQGFTSCGERWQDINSPGTFVHIADAASEMSYYRSTHPPEMFRKPGGHAWRKFRVVMRETIETVCGETD